MFKRLKESSIELSVLFNPTINKHKNNELENFLAPKPIMFCYKQDDDGVSQNVIYEIDGDKNIFETKVSRQNEEDFFNFADTFE